VETPSSILACTLITIRVCLGKAVEVAFVELFLVNCGRGNLNKAGITERRAKNVRIPKNHRILDPLLAAFDTLDMQSIHGQPPAKPFLLPFVKLQMQFSPTKPPVYSPKAQIGLPSL
jgi:hypothetical protein